MWALHATVRLYSARGHLVSRVNGAEIHPLSTHPSVYLTWVSAPRRGHHSVICSKVSLCTCREPVAKSKWSCHPSDWGGDKGPECTEKSLRALHGCGQVTYPPWTLLPSSSKGEVRGAAPQASFRSGVLGFCVWQPFLNSPAWGKMT